VPRYKMGQTQTADAQDEEAEAGARPDGSDEAALIGHLERALQGASDLPARSTAGAESRHAYDYPGAIELVRGAADFMRVMEERARESESRIQEILQRTAQELKAAEARAEAADQRTRAAEARAEDAERRARETQEWLDRILNVISEELKR
jgi:hypothetical protein